MKNDLPEDQSSNGMFNPFSQIPSFKALQDAVYQAVKIGYNEIIDRRTVGIPAGLFFRGLVQQTTIDLNTHLHMRPASEVRELVFCYLRCITLLADKAYDGTKDMPTDSSWNHRCELLEGLYSDLVEIIEKTQLYWPDCNAQALKVPDSVFELEWKDKLRDLFREVEPCLKARKMDKVLADRVYKPLSEMASWMCQMPLTWQRMYYYEELMLRIIELNNNGKVTNESLLNLLLNSNYNHSDIIYRYTQQMKAGLDKQQGATNKIAFLRQVESDVRLWQLPEHKGLNPDAPSVQEVILPLLQTQLSIQQELKLLEVPKNGPGTRSMVTKTDTWVTGWVIRILKETGLEHSPNLLDIMEGFCDEASINGSKDMTGKRLYNASYEMQDTIYYSVDGYFDECKAFARREWLKSKNKNKPPES